MTFHLTLHHAGLLHCTRGRAGGHEGQTDRQMEGREGGIQKEGRERERGREGERGRQKRVREGQTSALQERERGTDFLLEPHHVGSGKGGRAGGTDRLTDRKEEGIQKEGS